MSLGWIDEARVPIEAAAGEAGLSRARGGWAPCPCCDAGRRGSSDRRGPVAVDVTKGLWHCFRCKEGGDALSLVALAAVGTPSPRGGDWALVRALCARRGWASADRAGDRFRSSRARPRRGRRSAPPPAPPARVDPDEVAELWEACWRLLDHRPTCDWLRGFRVDPADVEDLDLARVLPPAGELPGWARLFAGGPDWRRLGHPLVLPMFDARGELRSLHARALDPGAKRKTLNPLGGSPAGLVFAEPLGRLLLSGEADALDRAPRPDVVVVEGVTDFLVAATRAGTGAALEAAPAVLGVVSGSWAEDSPLAQRIPEGVRVAVWTDPDEAGDRYAAKIIKSLAGRCRLYRGGRGA